MKMAISGISIFRSLFPRPNTTSPLAVSIVTARRFTVSASITSQEVSVPSPVSANPDRSNPWRPMCLYYTQGKCTMMKDSTHLEKFNHSCSVEHTLDASKYKNRHSQHLDFFLVLDLEGKVEILEFPVLMIDARTMDVVDLFHRFVRPSEMSEERIGQYIEGKYGNLGVDRVWHDTAIPFKEVIVEFEEWMTKHHLCRNELGGRLHRAAFVTCGNWDIKTQVPKQCKVSKMKLPQYFMEWINLKDVYLNFYKRRASGMRTMMRELNIPLLGSHHLGIDDTRNIARVLLHMLADGAVLQITARRKSLFPDSVEFLFENRIK